MNALSLSGVIILLLFEVIAVIRAKKLMSLLIYSSIAEVGYILLGIGSDTFAGQTGALLHLEYQVLMRGLVFLAAFIIVRRGGTPYIEKLKGIGRTSPFITTMFAFGIFSVMGLSPFKGSISKFVIVYSNIENSAYVFAAIAMLGSIIEAWYFIRTLHKICFAQDDENAQKFARMEKASVWVTRISYGAVIVLGTLTALTSLFPEPLIGFSEDLAKLIFGATKLAELPAFDSPWRILVLVPYIGAFAVFIISHFIPKLRGTLAVCISAVTVGMVWMDGNIDDLSKLFALIISVIVFLASIYSIGYFKNEKHNNRYFFFLLLTLGSLIGVVTSTQFGNFYVFWELMTWSSYLLIVHEPSEKALKAGFKYFMMCTSGAYIMQFGILVLQKSAGTLDMQAVSSKLPLMAPGLLIAVTAMFIIGAGVKAGLVPMHSWLPEAHPAAPSPVSAILSGILTKIGIYGLVRVLFVVFGAALLTQLGSAGKFSYTGLAISILGLATFFYGEIMALFQKDVKRMLAYSTMAQVGEIITTLGIGTYLSMVAGLYHVMNHAIMKGLLFLAVGILVYRLKSREISAFKGIGKAMPITAGCLSIGILAIMGLPPFNGFISKFLMLYAAVNAGYWYIAALLLLGSIIAVIYYIRLIKTVFFEKYEGTAVEEAPLTMLVPIGLLTGLVIFNGLFPQYALKLVESAANLIAVKGGLAVTAIPQIQVSWPVIIIIPMLGGLLAYFLGKHAPKAAGWISVAAVFVTLVAIVVSYTKYADGMAWMDGNIDGLSKLFALIISVVVFLASIYSMGYFKGEEHNNRYFFFLLLTFGSLIGIVTSTQFLNFYVFWELMTWASSLLIVHEPSERALKAGFKYFMMCTIGAFIMLFGILLLQSEAGSVDMGAISGKLPLMAPGLLIAVTVMFIIGAGVKAGLVPMHSWLPEAHPAAPSPVSAILSGILTKIGIYGLVRVLFVVFGAALLTQLGSAGKFSYTGLAISILGLATFFYGEIMALFQKDVKRMLAYSTMAQVGEIITTLGIGTYLSMVAGLYHVMNHAIMKGLLFLAVGILVYRLKSREISDFKGIGKAMPFTAGCLSIGILAIMGLPPFNGFISKFLMLYAAVNAGYWYIAALLLLGSIIAAIYYIRLIKTVFFEKYEGTAVEEAPLTMLLPIGLLTGLVIFNGLFPQYALKLVESAANLIAVKGGLAVTTIPQIQVSWPVIIIIPMLGGLLAYFLGKHAPKVAGWISVAVMSATLVAIAVSHEKYDIYSLSFALLMAFVGLLNILYSLGYMGHGHAQNRYYMFFLMMIGGLVGVATSKDFFSFFIYWEIMSSWTLYFSIIHEETKDALKEGFKYFVFNYIGASIAFLGILIITAKAGTFDMGMLAEQLKSIDLGTAGLGLTLMTVGFLMKAAVLPFRIDYQMHPATAPTPVSGYISSVLLKSAPYALIKLFFIMGGAVVVGRLGMVGNSSILMYTVSWIAGLTIIGAGAMALVQRGVKRLLIYSTVSQIGYIILGLSLGSMLGLTGAMLHFVNHMFFKDLLFLAAGAIMVQAHVRNLDDVSGLGRKMPVTLAFFMVGALSLAGVPPFSGFTSKWIIYEAAMQKGQVFLAILSLAGSVMTMAYFVKFMHSAFFGVPSKNSENVKEAPWTMLVPMGVLSAVSIIFGIMPGLPLTVISKVLSLAGIAQPSYTLFSVDTPIGTWQVGIITMALLLSFATGLVFLLSSSKKIRYTDAYTCGVTDLDGDKINASAQNMYETPDKLIRKLHKAIIPVFGDGEEVQE
ncbi:proton-conducting transporter transmembrane domain-containing protein [Desulfitobacterium sp. AusDCA]|uniref:complex I subunit 5 family protein n=1 Tax=Desulfitobacterium sp. AusDCA TaxID=3240383 RepID=UPI003DA78DA2